MNRTVSLPLPSPCGLVGMALITLALTSSPSWGTCTAGNPNLSMAESTPTADFTVNGDGTVTHAKTGLMWKQCAEGQSGASCALTGNSATFAWSGALAAAASANTANYAGHNDWRVPNYKELQSIVEVCGTGPAINQEVFPGTPAGLFWSSSAYVPAPANAWNINFDSGYFYANNRLHLDNVRLVRGGQSLGSFDLQTTNQIITGFTATPSSGTVGGSSTLSVSGSGASGNPVVYASSTTGICTVSGSTVNFVAVGTCTVPANQAGNAPYSAAPQASLNIPVGLIAQAITGFAATPSSGTVGGSSTLSVSGSGASGNPVVYASSTTGVCTVSGSTVNFVAAGTCTVTANQAGNASYSVAPQVTLNIPVNLLTQSISFGALANQTLGTPPFTVSATDSAGLPVACASLTPAVCTVAGNTVTLVSPGTCTLQATQAGNSVYAAAIPVTQSFMVTQAAAAIPTLGQWALTLLTGMLGLMGVARIRKT